MGFIEILIQVTWVAVVLFELTAAAVEFPIALPNCTDSCGGVEIPYPFGLREGCYLNHHFSVSCTTNSSGKTQPVISEDFIITNISLQGQIDMSMYIAHDCYDEQGVLDDKNSNDAWLNLSGIFTVSNTQNKFVVVGCDTYAYLQGYQPYNEQYSTGCRSQCESTRYIVNGSCSGVACCELDLPIGLRNITITSESFNKHAEVWSFNPCSYAFITRNGSFTFSVDALRSLRDKKEMPMVFDWAIGKERCKDVENICGGNSTCIDSDNGPGYRCECKDGYHGNPYLPHGCQESEKILPKEKEKEKESPNNIMESLIKFMKRGEVKRREKVFMEKQSFLQLCAVPFPQLLHLVTALHGGLERRSGGATTRDRICHVLLVGRLHIPALERVPFLVIGVDRHDGLIVGPASRR
ncbi:hypothetical protein SO802_010697 [Lithocarpus litseifolius]|uniref:EGF-like domain-containing protein n=1 Tax=Lithocarpus litseifolius TaxID=425828 RepID=A0AAW2DEX8_9ROSI